MKKRPRLIHYLSFASIATLSFCAFAAKPTATTEKIAATTAHQVILFVWDGMRPDAISPNNTPNLYQLMQAGVQFKHNHSSYPTFTMMNASSFATGDFAGKTGFYGNTLWDPKAIGPDANGVAYDFQQPVFTEDYHLLQDLNHQAPLVQVYTLFIQAHKKGIKTAAIGKSGPAFFQDYQQGGVVLDEKHAYPIALAHYLQQHHVPLPVDTVHTYSGFKLNKNNGNPTAYGKVATLKDKVTTNPNTTLPSPYNQDNSYLMQTYLQQIIPFEHPQLTVVWLRNPDTTEHNYGVGSRPFYSALHSQDQLLGDLIHHLKSQHQWHNTDLMVVSDHGHSNVSGPVSTFPLRGIAHNNVSGLNKNAYSVSGDMRPADLLSKMGFHAYDGAGCQYDPVMTGIMKNGQRVYPTLYDKTGKICGGDVKVIDQNGHRNNTVGIRYTTPAYKVPKILPDDAIIVAANGGSTYFYLPSHNPKLAKRVVRFLQSHPQFGAIFIDPRYRIAGTLPLSLVKLDNAHHRNPDIIAGSSYNTNTTIMGYKGSEYNSSGSDRGMHGSFSPFDVHNTLVAYGPDFKTHYIDTLPSGNVDVAPTIARIMSLNLPHTDGRALLEALKGGPDVSQYKVGRAIISSQPATNLTIVKVTDPYGHDIDKTKHQYAFSLSIKTLEQGGQQYTYFDQAKATRS